MEALRVVLAASFFGLAALALFLFSDSDTGLAVKGAELVPMGDGYALTARIENAGAADRLIGIGSEAAGTAALLGATGELAIPAGSAPSLAVDGAHGMLTGLLGDSGEGRLVPVTLWFDRAGKVTTRARVGAAMTMGHGAVYNVPQGEVPPKIKLAVAPDGDGWALQLSAEAFTISQDAVDSPHQAGVGHGHLYLNGLKLQRIYKTEARIGALPAGKHAVQVTLNTNDHRTYHVGGMPVTAVAEIVVD